MLGVRPRIVSFVSLLAALSLVAAVAAHVANAAPQHGVASARDAWIGAEADRLSGRNLTVTCADTQAEWGQELGLAGFPSAEADQYYGFSLIEQGELHLSPYVCEGLRLGAVARNAARERASGRPGRSTCSCTRACTWRASPPTRR